MINLQVQINEQIKTAMKEKDTLTKDTLKFLKGELERSGTKDYSNAAISKLAKKLIENIKESNTDKGDVAILQKFIPEQMSDDEIKIKVNEFLITNENAQMGQVMAYFKNNFDGAYDGKLLSSIVKEALAK